MRAQKKVFVALSGGVDSAVASHLLVKQGYDVEAVYMKYASESAIGGLETATCVWEDDIRYARATTELLNIPLHILNVEREYNDRIISVFLDEYGRGRTPNPDVLCNRDIKFGLFAAWAKEHGALAIATGHYARIDVSNGTTSLVSGIDKEKDQSYFLYAIKRSILDFVMFPVGTMTKKQVRAYALTHGLPNAQRPDSQGICFVGPLNVREFILSKFGPRPGVVTTSNGTIVGKHDGLPYYTIGQRHGLHIGGGTPYYVADKDEMTQTLMVAHGKNDPALFRRSCLTDRPNWLINNPPASFRCVARIRYRQPTVAVTVLNSGDSLTVTFDIAQRAVAPGQSVVLYDRERVIGGAIIISAHAL